jgi:hypothetical protein
VAAIVGILNPSVYDRVVSTDLIPMIFGQDLLSFAAAIAIILIALRTGENDSRKQLVIIGILGYFFYAYGIYTIERIYNMFYYLYLSIFGLSFWSIIHSIRSIRTDRLSRVILSDRIRKASAGFSLLVAIIFGVLWIVHLLPLLQNAEKIEFMYSIYILDLCFIMPVFAILGIEAIKKQWSGLILLPAMFVLGFTLIFSLAVSELVKPLYALPVSIIAFLPALILSLLFLLFAILHLRKMDIEADEIR